MDGEKKRFVTFNLAKPEEAKLFEFSKTINFAQFVKQALAAEMRIRNHVRGDGWQQKRPSE